MTKRNAYAAARRLANEKQEDVIIYVDNDGQELDNDFHVCSVTHWDFLVDTNQTEQAWFFDFVEPR